MTATARSTPRPARTRPLRDDLLDDLRQAAPMPTAPRKPDIPVPVVSAPVGSAPRPAGRPAPAVPETPTLELCVTPRLWWGLRMKTLGETPGVVIGAGPVQISLTGFRR
jgi:hypothetical protein